MNEPIKTAKQLSDLHLLLAKVYSQLSETEEIAVSNREFGLSKDAELTALRDEFLQYQNDMAVVKRRASEYELIANVFLQFEVVDLNNMKEYVGIELDVANYDTEQEYVFAREYQEAQLLILDKLVSIRKGIRGLEL